MKMSSTLKILSICAIIFAQIICVFSATQKDFQRLFDAATRSIESNNFDLANQYLLEAIRVSPSNIEANQLLGVVSHFVGDDDKAYEHTKKALELDNYQNVDVIGNFIEILRRRGDVEEALRLGEKYSKLYPDAARVRLNYACALEDLRRFTEAIPHLKHVLKKYPAEFREAWKTYARILMEGLEQWAESEAVLLQALQYHANDATLLYYLGRTYFFQNRLEDSIAEYHKSLQAEENRYQTKVHLAAAYQLLGREEDAMSWYQKSMPFEATDAATRNNYGALLGVLNRKDEEAHWLREALEIQPTMVHAVVNLAGYYQDLGLLEETKELLERAIHLEPDKATTYMLRKSYLLSPVSQSWEAMLAERRSLETSLRAFITEVKANPGAYSKGPTNGYDRIHFYLPYSGLNDKPLQDLVVEGYYLAMQNFEHISDNLESSLDKLREQFAVKSSSQFASSTRKVRIGFISKYFGIFEPHALLLDGIMKSLPRLEYEVVVLGISINGAKPMAPSVMDAADQYMELSLVMEHAISAIERAKLDVLVFADTLSEPMNHFLMYNRLAPIQVAFWGNPITTGSKHIDYFVSGEYLEHPHRTRMRAVEDPYSEQVVLLEGQAIWYYAPEPSYETLKKSKAYDLMSKLAPPKDYTRDVFGIQDDWFVYFCPQSVFKMHPLFDTIFARILAGNPKAHLYVTAGRRKQWTDKYMARLGGASAKYAASIGVHEDLSQRIHLIDRVSSEQFLALMKIADTVLHPFPFDGSRTSADALMQGVPMVTLPSEYLRGRMGMQFLRTMNLPELVARNASDYVEIALRLSLDTAFRQSTLSKIQDNMHLMWEDMEVPYTWTRFLNRAVGLPTMSFEAFLEIQSRQANRSTSYEMSLHRRREQNRKLFDASFGKEEYLLQGGEMIMEYNLETGHRPRIFEDWAASAGAVRTGIDGTYKGPSSNTLASAPSSKERASSAGSTSKPKSPIILSSAKAADASQISGGTLGRPADNTVMSAQKSSSRSNSLMSGISIKTGSESKPLVGDKMPEPNPTDSGSKIKAESAGGAEGEGDMMSRIAALKGKVRKDAEVFREVKELMFAGRVDEAYKKLTSVQKTHATDPLYLVELGSLQLYRGEHDKSIKLCQAAVRLQPDHILAHSCIGVGSTYLGDKDTALNAYRAVYKIHKSNVPKPTSDMFSLPAEAIYTNLISALGQFDEPRECMSVVSDVFGIPDMATGGAYLLLFALVDWSPDTESLALKSFASRLLQEKKLVLEQGKTFMAEIRRIQHAFAMVLNPAASCVLHAISTQTKNEIMGALVELMTINNKADAEDEYESMNELFQRAQSDPSNRETYRKSGVALITQYFLTEDRNLRNDLDQTLLQNLNNVAISEIYLLTEQQLNFDAVPNAWKIKQGVIGERLTFSTAFQFANEQLQGRTVILANADIHFDETLHRLGNVSELDMGGEVMALLKWMHPTTDELGDKMIFPVNGSTGPALLEYLEGGTSAIDIPSGVQASDLTLNLRTDAQDAWVFQPPLSTSVTPLARFPLGVPRCDNRIAEVLEQAGHHVYNPVFAIHAIEMHSAARGSSLYALQGAAVGDGRFVLLSDRHTFY
jgi:predicted O-linked N-acetylglucosamine transferase (SPINDLY family)